MNEKCDLLLTENIDNKTIYFYVFYAGNMYSR